MSPEPGRSRAHESAGWSEREVPSDVPTGVEIHVVSGKKSPTRAAAVNVPLGYTSFLDEVKARIRAAQVKAALAVNAELVLLYWRIGLDILARQKKEGWGAQVIDRLSTDLRAAFPEMKGFSPRNLKYMCTFAATWPEPEFVQQVAARWP
jgi:DUF1016 N-terminal domain